MKYRIVMWVILAIVLLPLRTPASAAVFKFDGPYLSDTYLSVITLGDNQDGYGEYFLPELIRIEVWLHDLFPTDTFTQAEVSEFTVTYYEHEAMYG